MNTWKKRFYSSFRLGISLVIIIWLVQLAEGSRLAETLKSANLGLVSIVFLTANLDRLLMSYKWHLLLKARQVRVPFIQVIGAYYKSSFWGNFILPSIGADTLRVIEISRRIKKSDAVISSVVIERAIGLIATMLVGLSGLVLFTLVFDRHGWRNLILVVLLIGGLAALFLASFNRSWFSWPGRWLGNSRWGMLRKLEKVWISYQEYSSDRQVLFFFFLLSLLEQLSPVINTFLIARALSIQVSFATLLMFVPLIILIIRLPISFEGFGVREGLFIYTFGLVGIDKPQAFLLGLLPSVITRMAIALPSLFFFLSARDSVETGELETRAVALED